MRGGRHTVQRNNAEDEAQAQHEHDDRVDLEPGGLISVELCTPPLAKKTKNNRITHCSSTLPPFPVPVPSYPQPDFRRPHKYAQHTHTQRDKHTEHSRAGTTRTGGTRGAGSGVGDLLGAILGGAAADGGLRTSGGGGRAGTGGAFRA